MCKHDRFDKPICGNMFSSQTPDLFLLNFSCLFDPPDTLSYWSTEQRNNPNMVNGNLGIILHAAQKMWRAAPSDWFSNNWEIWDKSRYICVLITLDGRWYYLPPAHVCSGDENSDKIFLKRDFGSCPSSCAKPELRRPKVLHGPVEIIIWYITSIFVFWDSA